MQNEVIETVRGLIRQSRQIVFFGGAGVSTASNIPDFRSSDGLYNRVQQSAYSTEEMLSHDFLVSQPELFFQNLRENLIFPDAKPNAAHIALARLERLGRLQGIVTQNIDGLHQKAGSENVIELHGNIARFYCTASGRPYPLADIMKSERAPRCSVCRGSIRPDVVLYQEMLDGDVLQAAVDLISAADVLIVGGTSLVVYPAAGLLQHYCGNKLVLINRDPTPYDSQADYLIQGNIAEILTELMDGVD